MRKFLKSLGIFLIILIVINLLVYQFITGPLLYFKYDEPKKDKDIRNCKTIILADSHGWWLTRDYQDNMVALVNNGIYNFSYGSDSYSDMLLKFQWSLENMNIDRIFLQVDDHLLSKNSSNAEKIISYCGESDYQDAYGTSSFKYYGYFIIRYFPLFYPSNQKLIKEYLTTELFTWNNDDDVTNQISWQNQTDAFRKEKATEKFNDFFPDEDYKVNKVQLKALIQIINLAEKNNVTVIGIRYPVDYPLLDLVVSNEFDGLVAERASQEGLEIILDYSSLFNDPSFFSNQDHVNLKGAEALVDSLLKIHN